MNMNTKAIKNAETAIIRFMEAWKTENEAYMYDNSQVTWKATNQQAWLRTLLARKVNNYQIISHAVSGEYAIDFSISVNKSQPSKVRVICETQPYTPGNGTWGVNPLSALRLMQV